MRGLYLCIVFLAAGLTIFALSGAAHGAVITAVDRSAGTSGDRDPIGVFDGETDPLPTEAGGLIDGNVVFSDRTYGFSNTPEWIQGTEYVRTFNTDKSTNELDVNYAVTFSEATTAFVTMDDRLDNPQDRVDAIVSAFAAPGTFADTGADLFIREREDGSRDRPMSVFSAPLAAGTYNFGANPCNENFHQIGVLMQEPPKPIPYVEFLYSTAKGGTISGMLDTTGVGGSGDVLFTGVMPEPTIVDPNSALTPAGSVGTITEPSGEHNTTGKSAGLSWSGQVELTGTDGVKEYSILVDLVFGPSGDPGYNNPGEDLLSSFDALSGPQFVYEWEIEINDDAVTEHGGDAVTTGNGARMAVFFGVGEEIANGGAHRFTQIERKFNAGPDEYTNTDETTDSTKWTKYAAWQDLGIYYAWRDRDTLSDGSFQVDSISFSGNLPVDLMRMVPEPSSLALLAAGAALLGLILWRRR